jgi:hypothetical protein
MKDEITIKQAIARLRYWLIKNNSGLQTIPDFRLQIFMYNFGDIVKYQAYNSYYGIDNNPIKITKDDLVSDAIVQFLLYLLTMNVDIEKSLLMGIEKIENNEFSKKKSLNVVKMESDGKHE